MKKIIMLSIALSCYFVNAQNNNVNIKKEKFQLGLSYALTSDVVSYKNPFNASINYQLKKWGAIDLGVGIQVYMFSPKSEYKKNFSTRWGFNPNVSSSYSFLNNKLRTYFAFGYYFDNYKLTTDELPPFTASYKNAIKSTGLTFVPGFKYFLNSNIYFDINYTFLNVKTKYGPGFSYTSNNNLFNVGLGVAF